MEKIAGSIAEAAEMVGLSTSAFRRVFLQTGLIKSYDFGGRAQGILFEEVRAAAEKIAEDQRADPSLAKLRSSGAHLAARGVIPNRWGRSGRPKNLKAPKR